MDWSAYLPFISPALAIFVAVFLPIINRKLNVIHTLTNSNLTAANKRLDDMTKKVEISNNEISSLREMIAGIRGGSKTEVAESPKLPIPEGVKVLEVKTEVPDAAD